MNGISELLEECSSIGTMDPDYWRKMMHHVPATQIVDRGAFILSKCKDKRVVNFGSSSGRLHDRIKKVASEAYGVDKEGKPDYRMDLDDEFYNLCILPLSDVFVCGELLEHLSNPGSLLRRLKIIMRRHPSELIITVPNAFADAGRYWMAKGYEQVNVDHCAWYSWHSLKVLVERCDFKILNFLWYGEGSPGFNEGLIFVVS